MNNLLKSSTNKTIIGSYQSLLLLRSSRRPLQYAYYGNGGNTLSRTAVLMSSSSSSYTALSSLGCQVSSSSTLLTGMSNTRISSHCFDFNQIPLRRYFSSSSSSSQNQPNKSNNKQEEEGEQQEVNNPNNFDHLPPLESANPDRIRGIQVNPDSIGFKVLPGNLVYKYYKFTGNTRKVPLELTHGYFWMIRDLQKTNNKPTLSNERLIPKEDRQLFPTLTGFKTLNNEVADLPYFFIDDKKHKENNNCTLVSISFRDSGYKNISSWTKPFEDIFIGKNKSNNNSVKSYKISITERGSLYLLKGFLSKVMKNNTPPNEYDTTLLYFNGWGKTYIDDFRDVLRMHNIMTNYVFLLDNLGCIRFAGSGPASDEDTSRLIRFTKELTTSESNSGGGSGGNKSSSNISKMKKKKRGGTKSR